MSKKQRKNLQQRINKRQQLQQLGQTATPSVESGETAGAISLPPAPTLLALPEDTRLIKEVRRTLLSFLLIAVILVIVVIIDRRSPYLLNLGNHLFSFLRLN